MLHVLNGDVTRAKLERSGVPGAFAVWADVLHDGPCRLLPADEWRGLRSRHLASQGFASEAEIAAQYARWDERLAAWSEHQEVVFWLEHDLFDQLLLIRHLYWLSTLPPSPNPAFSLICINEYPGVEDFVGLGCLTPEQLASLFGTRHVVSVEEIALGVRAWTRFCGSDPLALAALLCENTRALPFLHAALERFLADYPAVQTGLSRSERQILRAVEHGHTTPADAFRATQAMEAHVFMGDRSWWTIVRTLASGPAPALRVAWEPLTGALPSAQMELTESGRHVLAGTADHVSTNGIDRWMGGVHLTDGRWRWTGTTVIQTG